MYNRAIFTVAELLREGQPGGVLPGRVLEIIVGLPTWREALRKVRGVLAVAVPTPAKENAARHRRRSSYW